MVRASRSLALKAAIALAPEYADLLKNLQKDEGRNIFPPDVFALQNKLGSYVLNYDNELKIGCALFLSFLGEEGFKDFTAQMAEASPEEQQELLDEMGDVDNLELDEALEAFDFPLTPEAKSKALEELNALPEEERKDTEKRTGYFWSFFFSNFFNTLSLMVHGAKLTALVPLALAGDDDAFLKAVQIDRMLLIHHPYFRDRKLRAQNEGEREFLSKLAYRETSSPVRGKIRYPGLYMLFGILDSFQWLDDLRREEILDICDEARLDRFQNRIEDVNYVTKRLIEYRQWQKSGSLSMH